MFCIVSIIFFVLTIKNRFFVVTYEIKFDEKLMREWNFLLTKKNDNSIVAEIALLFANSIINNQTSQSFCMYLQYCRNCLSMFWLILSIYSSIFEWKTMKSLHLMSRILQNVYQTNDMNCESRFDIMKKNNSCVQNT